MMTLTKKSAKDLAKRIEVQNLQTYMHIDGNHKISIEVWLPSWLTPGILTENGSDKEAFEKKLRQTLRTQARKKGYTIREMEERLPEAAYDVLRGVLRYTFTREENKNILLPAR